MDNHNNQLTINGFIKTLSILHLALVAGVFLLGAVVYLQNPETKINFSDTSNIFLFIVPIIALSGFLMGNFLYKKQLNALLKKDNLKEKLGGYQSASIIKYALIEGPSLISIVVFSMNQNIVYLIIAAVLVSYLYLQRPSKDKIERELNLRGELKKQFNNVNQKIE